MALQKMIDSEMNLVLSNDAKPRMKWTAELHQRFIDAVNQLGGAEKATPKSVMRVMGIHELTLYHLKSHLQKYRLGQSPHSRTCQKDNKEEYETQMKHFTRKGSDGAQEENNESLQIAETSEMHIEVQRKFHEQIEVQKHLQLRIEAQTKYLQSILKKAHETLSTYSSIEAERAKEKISELITMVDSGCPSSSFSVLTEIEAPVFKDGNELFQQNRCLQGSFSSSSGKMEETSPKTKVDKNYTAEKSGEVSQATSRKRNKIAIDLNCELVDDFE